ncbi:PHP domain [Musa troglodytarum]|uniref:PHP domain n=1 Tax=Musa troglodytarum TaxID=320322 RepID=A0A9E7FQV5_9LILI|nr:PHP domain [Musa troglodytarum]
MVLHDAAAAADAADADAGRGEEKKRRRRKRKGRGRRKKATAEEILASGFVRRWAFPDASVNDHDGDGDDGKPTGAAGRVVFEFHSHSTCSDGFLSPTALVERAHSKGITMCPEQVDVLALTDHDTMAGVAEAVEAANKFGIRIIPGVEISAVYSPREESETEEPVHILAYYGSCGPSQSEDLENLLANIRYGRYLRAEEMLVKLSKLKMPLKWEHVAKIAGDGVAPGRVHVARAMVESGYVENLKQAFSRYLYDGGPAYAKGSEPFAEDVVQLICHTGGVATLAHPWALKNPVVVIGSLKASGLHAMEVYRSDGKLSGFGDLADRYELVKIGGSDYHGRSGQDESDLGSVALPVLAVYEFLKLAQPIWHIAMRDMLSMFANEPSDINLQKIIRFGKFNLTKDKEYSGVSCGKDVLDLCLSSWLNNEERENSELEAIKMKLSDIVLCDRKKCL